MPASRNKRSSTTATASQSAGPSRASRSKGKGKGKAVKKEESDDSVIALTESEGSDLSDEDDVGAGGGNGGGGGGRNANRNRNGANNPELRCVLARDARPNRPRAKKEAGVTTFALCDATKLRAKASEIARACEALASQAHAIDHRTWSWTGQPVNNDRSATSVQYQGLAMQAQVESLLVLLKEVGIKVKNAS